MGSGLVRIFIIALISLALNACKNEQPLQTNGQTIKIGYVGPLSSEDKGWGRDGLDGVRLIQSLQPVLSSGEQIELIVADDENDPERARQVLEQLVVEDEVAAILTISDSQTVLGVAAMAKQFQVPILALNATHPDVTENGFISQLLFDDQIQGTVAALYVIDEMLIDRAAVFKDQANPYSSFLADTFSRRFSAAGGIVEEIIIDESTSAYETILQLPKDDGTPLLYLPLRAEQVIDIELANRAIGYEPEVLVADGLLGQIAAQFSEHLAVTDGLYSTDSYTSDSILTKFGKLVVNSYRREFDEKGTTFTLLGCEGAAILIEAIERCQEKTDRSCINDALRSTNDFIGAIGKISIKFNGKAERTIYINQIRNGQLRLVVKVY